MAKLPHANKDLGQHFLRSDKVIQRIINDHQGLYDVIVEVGPGPAILTEHLAKLEKPLYVLEKDSRFKEKLSEFVSEDHIFMGDALSFDWNHFIENNQLQGKKIWLVSNLPYNIGTILFVNFLQIKEISLMTLMFQKEVGDKTYLRDEKNQMNGLLFLSLNYFESKQLIKAPPGCFAPPPKVDSVVVSYKRLGSPKLDIAEFKRLNQFTRALFAQKRKQIGSVLKSHFDPEKLLNAFERSGISRTLRAESLTQEQIYKLYNALF